MPFEPSALLALDLGLRGGVVLLALLLSALLLRAHPHSLAARLGALFATGSAAFVLMSTPGFAAPPRAWQAPLIALSAANTVVFWLFARALFNDAFRLKAWHALAWTGLAAMVLVGCFALAPGGVAARALGNAYRFANLVFTLLALGEALASWRADLVEGRRRLRVFVVGVAGVYALANTLAQLMGSASQVPAAVTLLNSLCLLIVVLLVAWPLLRLSGAELFVDEPIVPPLEPREEAPQPPAPQPDAQPPELPAPPARPEPSAPPSRREIEAGEPPDPVEVAALQRLMREQHVYREEGLTIGSLAARLGLPEYKLRRLINQGLGHRNFNTFLNGYRLAEVKAALADPARAEVPVLVIAMDAGFQSLGPFNRAFKAETGLTPTEFRRLRGRPPQEKSTLAPADSEIG
jgi:AraC-like DNA-binding protein